MKIHFVLFLIIFSFLSCGENSRHKSIPPESKTVAIDSMVSKAPKVSEAEIQKREFLESRITNYKAQIPVMQRELDSSGNYIMGKDSPQKFRRMLELDNDIKGMEKSIPPLEAELQQKQVDTSNHQIPPLQQMKDLVKNFEYFRYDNLKFLCDQTEAVNEKALQLCWLQYDLSVNRKHWKNVFKNSRMEIKNSEENRQFILVYPDSSSVENIQFQFIKRNDEWFLSEILD